MNGVDFPGLRKYENEVPENFLTCEVADLQKLLRGPSLFKFEGESKDSQQPLFVCTLLHGNEHTGFLAVQQLLQEFVSSGKKPMRTFYLFLGNTFAAAQNLRLLPGQTDYNRIWSDHDGQEKKLAEEIKKLVRELRPFAAIDLHNNTGLNPHYACVADTGTETLNLARHFSRHVMIFRKPESTFGVAFAKVCPTVTLEAGLSGDASGVAHVTDYLRSLLGLHQIPQQRPLPHEIDLFENICSVKLKHPEQTVVAPLDTHSAFIFEESSEAAQTKGEKARLCLRADIDSLNFTEISTPTLIGRTLCGEPFPFVFDSLATNASVARSSELIESAFFLHREDGHLFFKGGALPSMLTPKLEAMQLDCVCYLMEKIVVSET